MTYAVSYCVGHLFEQEEPDAYLPDDIQKTGSGKKRWRASDLPIVPDVWKTKPKKEALTQLKVLGDLIKISDEVVHAGDVDREGQAIVDDVIDHFSFSGSVKRFSVSAQDEESIRRGLSSLDDNAKYVGWRLASKARQRADWLVGMNLTRSLTLAAQAKGSDTLLVVGRVQSPTLALVVNRDESIKNFKSIDYYQINAELISSDGEKYSGRFVAPDGSKYLDDQDRIIDKESATMLADELKTIGSGIVTLYEKKPMSTPQPLGLSLSDITLIASNKHGMTADGVLTTVQALYEKHKLCSYPRSDCSYLPESQLDDARNIVDAIGKTHEGLSDFAAKVDLDIKSRVWNDKKVTAHHAIVPTQKVGNISELNAEEKAIYELISRNYLAQFYGKHEYDSTVIETTVGNHVLRTKGNTVSYAGWKSVYSNDEKTGKEKQVLLPVLSEGSGVSLASSDVITKKTTPPKHFTEGTLIKALENIYKYVDDDASRITLKEEDGIGTPATRSAIISELKRRGYLELKKKNILSTDSGKRLVSTLPEAVVSPVLTAMYERQLKEIQNGSGDFEAFINTQVDYVTDQVNKASVSVDCIKVESDHPCECGANLVRRKSKDKDTHWWGCAAYPGCKNTYKDLKGKPDMSKKTSSGSVTEHKCAKCEKPLIERKSAKGKVWYGCSGFPACKERYFQKAGAPNYG